MSHFTQVKTRLRDRNTLIAALKKLGHTVVEGADGQVVRGFMGDTQSAEFKILTETHYDIGFARDGQGNYFLVGDWELLPKVSGVNPDELLVEVKREYAREAILQTAERQGYQVEVEEKDGCLEMVVVQW
ncbi:DUF1257 domain-containing protein [bacterium]|nr:DUF1257 domain-containing protein [bacterium]